MFNDGEKDDYTFQVALGFGKAFAKNLSCYIMPEYVVSGPTQKTFIIQVNLNGMFRIPADPIPAYREVLQFSIYVTVFNSFQS